MKKKPPWLKVRIPASGRQVESVLRGGHLHTVCEEAGCPNKGECWSSGTATFLILGDICTRNCAFCAVKKGAPLAPDSDEAERISEAVEKMELKYLVLTSPTRDDLVDGGAEFWANTVNFLRQQHPDIAIEVLVPDFQGDRRAWEVIFAAKPDVLNHNIETVPRLYETVRSGAEYGQSLRLLAAAASHNLTAKTGLMLGLGETLQEVESVLEELYESGVRHLTLGQYLAPSPAHQPVDRWVTPAEFKEWKGFAEKIGFKQVASAPLVRSSYHAAEQFTARTE